jgi:hypothetical protein
MGKSINTNCGFIFHASQLTFSSCNKNCNWYIYFSFVTGKVQPPVYNDICIKINYQCLLAYYYNLSNSFSQTIKLWILKREPVLFQDQANFQRNHYERLPFYLRICY